MTQKTISVDFTADELRLIINALGSSSLGVEQENDQFRLYHSLVIRLNSAIKNDE